MVYNGFRILNHSRFATKVVQAVGKGALPKVLQGSFSDDRTVQQAIDSYVLSKKKKRPRYAKTNSTTGNK